MDLYGLPSNGIFSFLLLELAFYHVSFEKKGVIMLLQQSDKPIAIFAPRGC